MGWFQNAGRNISNTFKRTIANPVNKFFGGGKIWDPFGFGNTGRDFGKNIPTSYSLQHNIDVNGRIDVTANLNARVNVGVDIDVNVNVTRLGRLAATS
jgi:hypothetical protein